MLTGGINKSISFYINIYMKVNIFVSFYVHSIFSLILGPCVPLLPPWVQTLFHFSKAQLVHFLDELHHQKQFERTVFQDFGPLFSLCCSWSHRTFKQSNEPADLFSLFSGSGGGTVLVDNVQLNSFEVLIKSSFSLWPTRILMYIFDFADENSVDYHKQRLKCFSQV